MTILVVDDKKEERYLLETLLKGDGYEVVSTANGAEALEKLRAQDCDIVISDILMPVMDGFQLCRKVKEEDKLKDIPFIFYTATYTDEEDEKLALTVGADKFIRKPIDPDEFTNIIRSVVGSVKKDKAESQNLFTAKKEDALELYSKRLVKKLEKKMLDLEKEVTACQRAEQRIQRQLDYLTALNDVDIAINASLDLRVILNVLLDQVTDRLEVDAADLLLLNRHSHMLEYTASRGFRSAAIERSHLRLGEGHSGRAALERQLVHIPNLLENEETFMRASLLADEDFIAYFCVPLIAKGQVKGVLEIFHRTVLNPDSEWLKFLEALAEQAVIAIDNATLFEELQRSNTELILAYDRTLEGWVKALDLRDKETEGHTVRVAEMTVRLARAMEINDEEIVHVHRGALLHDIGKMAIPDAILHKPDTLTEEEWVLMHKHPLYAYEWLNPIAYLRPALDIPYCHHEKWDGTGYPRGLQREEIPLTARIFAVVDVWDALRSDRPYRKAWPEEKVLNHIREQAGTHFDPVVVETFLEMLSGA